MKIKDFQWWENPEWDNEYLQRKISPVFELLKAKVQVKDFVLGHTLSYNVITLKDEI